ncbi:MAG: hypothetical protein Q9198_002040 [Flavoplaca austrocitrina]
MGHRHDWEGIVVKWQKDPEGDWWHRSRHRDEATGLNRRHPKVFVGFFSHASFPEIYKGRKTAFNAECPEFQDLLGNEYRYTVETLSYKTDHNVDTHIGVTIGGVYHAWKTFVQLAILTVRLLPT